MPPFSLVPGESQLPSLWEIRQKQARHDSVSIEEASRKTAPYQGKWEVVSGRGIEPPNTRIKSPLLCLIELAAQTIASTELLAFGQRDCGLVTQ